MPAPTQADIDYLKAHPEVADKFRARFGSIPDPAPQPMQAAQPTQADIEFLQANPEVQAKFEARFGPASKYIQPPEQPAQQATIPMGVPGARGQQFINRTASDFESGARTAARGVGDIMNSAQHAFSSGNTPSPSFQEGNILTGIPRVAYGGLGAIFSPITAAAAPITDQVVQPIGEAIDSNISKPVEKLTGYPSDVTTPLTMQALTMGLMKGAGALTKGAKVPGKSVAPRTGEPTPQAMPKPAQEGAAKPLTMDDVRQQAEMDYKASEDAGIVLKPETVKEMVDKLTDELAQNGYHPRLQPTTAVALEELANVAGKPITLKGVDTIRQVVNGAAQVTNAKDMRMAGKVIKRIDEMVRNLDETKVMMGDAEKGVPALLRARDAWARVKKAEIIDEAMARAQRQANKSGSGGNIDNAMRQQIGRILERPRLRRGFSKSEIAQMEKVVNGRGKIHDTLRRLGKLSPEGNGLMLMLSNLGGAGIMTGAINPMAMALPIAGAIAKPISNAMTRGSVSTLSQDVLRGRALPPKPPSRLPQGLVPPLVGLSSRPPERTY